MENERLADLLDTGEDPVADSIRTGPKQKWSQSSSRLLFWLSYIVCISLSVLFCFILIITDAWTEQSAIPNDPYYVAMVQNLMFTVFIALWSAYYNNSGFYDAWWSVGPIVFIVYWILISKYERKDIPLERVILVTISVVVWGIRLTSNWYFSWPGLHHEDWRILNIKRDYLVERKMPKWVYWIFGAFGTAMMSQTVFIGLGSFPAYIALYKDTKQENANETNALDYVAAFICVSAAITSYIADRQMRLWRMNKPDPGAYINVGLWKYSRHPNYFGEISFWWGLYIFALAVNPEEWWWTFFGALSISALFIFASIPMMEKRSVSRRPKFKECQNTVSMLIPWFPKKPNSEVSNN